MKERMLAEAQLASGATLALMRSEAGDYWTLYAEGGERRNMYAGGRRAAPQGHRSIGHALFEFTEAIREAETWALVEEAGEET